MVSNSEENILFDTIWRDLCDPICRIYTKKV